jgi:CubicO group peptidase (beta-lactamase class C family)
MNDSNLAINLDQIIRRMHVPALAAAACVKGRLCELAAVGKRSTDGHENVTSKDKWHVGSCTKPMTSTLAGILIEQKRLDWTTTIAEVFENWIYEIHSDWHHATLEQLLSHRAGAPAEPPKVLWEQAWKRLGTPTDQRIDFVRGLLAEPPKSVPGTAFQYSNQGYAIAGLMLETCMKRDWEALIAELVFRPLQMDSAGFGAPGSPTMVDEPRGHRDVNGKLEPVEPGPGADNPPAISPAGSVHCSIEDLLKFATSHTGSCSLVSEETLQRLHHLYTDNEYSLGWIVVNRTWSGGNVLNHNGSNTMWFATMWVAPLEGAAFVAATNAAGAPGQEACDQACTKMILRHLGRGNVQSR